MRVQWELLLGLFIINLSIGVVMQLALPGTEFVTAGTAGVDASQYEQQFNSSKITSWGGTPFSGIPVIGDIFAGFNYLWQNVGYLVDGLPQFLNYLKFSFIADSEGQLAFDVIANVLRAVYAFLIMMFLIEFISGRYFSD